MMVEFVLTCYKDLINPPLQLLTFVSFLNLYILVSFT